MFVLVENIIITVITIFIVVTLISFKLQKRKFKHECYEKSYDFIYVCLFFMCILGVFTQNWFIVKIVLVLIFIVLFDILFYIEKLQKRVEELIEIIRNQEKK